ncbi:hypothetical protein B484DRAFT_464393 [Ochromonadaceae sp. CCMP2298]|nr:hypothetical protein B484DRAFT_464393 [Ochromonadaceae sp. CCMP2298]
MGKPHKDREDRDEQGLGLKRCNKKDASIEHKHRRCGKERSRDKGQAGTAEVEEERRLEETSRPLQLIAPTEKQAHQASVLGLVANKMAEEMSWDPRNAIPSLIWSVDGYAGAHLALSDMVPLAVVEGLVPLTAEGSLNEVVGHLTELQRTTQASLPAGEEQLLSMSVLCATRWLRSLALGTVSSAAPTIHLEWVLSGSVAGAHQEINLQRAELMTAVVAFTDGTYVRVRVGDKQRAYYVPLLPGQVLVLGEGAHYALGDYRGLNLQLLVKANTPAARDEQGTVGDALADVDFSRSKVDAITAEVVAEIPVGKTGSPAASPAVPQGPVRGRSLVVGKTRARQQEKEDEAALHPPDQVETVPTRFLRDTAVPVGLVNHSGVDCYVNSVVQVLLQTQELVSAVLECGTEEKHRQVTLFLRALFLQMRTEMELKAAISTTLFRDTIVAKGRFVPDQRSFNKDRQEDAMELLGLLLEKMCQEDDGETVAQIFQGSYISDLRCRACGTPRACGTIGMAFPEFNHLTLEISDPLIKSVDAAVAAHLAEEHLEDSILDGGCRSCRRTNMWAKQLSIQSSPPVLILHLGRFINKRNSKGEWVLGKIYKFVEFTLQLSLQCHDGREEDYSLYAVIEHHGRVLANGHYTASVLIGDDWYNADDSSVKKEGLKHLLQRKAYVLMYRKR